MVFPAKKLHFVRDFQRGWRWVIFRISILKVPWSQMESPIICWWIHMKSLFALVDPCSFILMGKSQCHWHHPYFWWLESQPFIYGDKNRGMVQICASWPCYTNISMMLYNTIKCLSQLLNMMLINKILLLINRLSQILPADSPPQRLVNSIHLAWGGRPSPRG